MTSTAPSQLADRSGAFKIDFSWPVLFAFAALLCVLIVLPMSWLVYYSLRSTRRRVHASKFRDAVHRAGIPRAAGDDADPRDLRQRRLLPGRRADGLAGGAHRPAAAPQRCARW